MKAHKGNGSILPFIPNLSIRWRRVVNIMSQALYPQEKLQSPLNRRLGGLDGFEDDKLYCPYQRSKPKLSSPALVTILTTLPWLAWFKYKTIKKRDGFIGIWLGMLHCSNSMINMKLHKTTSDESSLIVYKLKVTSLFYIKQKQLP
jgi:hypothetical protein